MIKLLPIPHILMPMTSWGCSSLTSPKRPLKILFDYPRDVPICCLRDVPVWRPREVPNQSTRDFTWNTLSGCPPEDFQKTSYQLKLCGICNWMSPNLTFLTFLTFFNISLQTYLIDLTYLNAIQDSEAYLERSHISMMERFAKLLSGL